MLKTSQGWYAMFTGTIVNAGLRYSITSLVLSSTEVTQLVRLHFSQETLYTKS